MLSSRNTVEQPLPGSTNIWTHQLKGKIMPHLRCEIEQGLATIVLNNPPQNRLSAQMVDELCEFVDVVGTSEARAVLLHAERRKALTT
jgi:enoyl-CoA hydratase/carnithine racemase